MATPHNAAAKGEIAATVLMPGDPLRAKYIAETYLENVRQFNTVRNMFGYTGTYRGKEVSVMGSGMGMPSIGIYSYELYTQYGVENIIRVGSAGAYHADLQVPDLVLVDSAWSESTYAKVQGNATVDVQPPGAALDHATFQAAERLNPPLFLHAMHSSDVFYRGDTGENYRTIYEKHGCKCVEMESFALFHNAKVLGKQAACLLTISDSFVSETALSAKERETSFNAMMKLALETAITL